MKKIILMLLPLVVLNLATPSAGAATTDTEELLPTGEAAHNWLFTPTSAPFTIWQRARDNVVLSEDDGRGGHWPFANGLTSDLVTFFYSDPAKSSLGPVLKVRILIGYGTNFNSATSMTMDVAVKVKGVTVQSVTGLALSDDGAFGHFSFNQTYDNEVTLGTPAGYIDYDDVTVDLQVTADHSSANFGYHAATVQITSTVKSCDDKVLPQTLVNEKSMDAASKTAKTISAASATGKTIGSTSKTAKDVGDETVKVGKEQ